MNTNDLTQLSFEQLSEIQNRISDAINTKKTQRIEDAVTDLIDLLASKFPDVSLSAVLYEIAFRTGIQLESLGDSGFTSSLGLDTLVVSKTASKVVGANPDIELLAERLKATRNSILQKEDSRLLWLTNRGTQKTSKLFGKDLAEVLQETIKKIERLEGSEEEVTDSHTVHVELEKIDQWAKLHLGIPLFQGTLTVISSFETKQSKAKDNARLSQRSPTPDSAMTAEITFPLNNRRGIQGYAAQ